MSSARVKPKIVVIAGPTASGKTELGIHLAKKFNGEVVSADSRQVYQELSIGTAKPTGKWEMIGGERKYIVSGIPHYLMDFLDPKEDFTLQDFQKYAIDAIVDITNREKLPFVVGGTGLYLYALLENLNIPAVPPNTALRRRLESKPTEQLYAELEKKDPEAAETTGHNKRRIIRALEVIEETDTPFSKLRTKGPELFNALKLAPNVTRDEAYERSVKRIDAMLKEGLLDEVQELARKYSWDLPSMQSIGYQEFQSYLKGKESREEALTKLKTSYKYFIRRQFSWFKRDKDIRWVADAKEAERHVKAFIASKAS